MLLLQAGDDRCAATPAESAFVRWPPGAPLEQGSSWAQRECKQCKEVGQCAQAHLCRRGCTAPRLPGAHQFQQLKPRRLPRGSVSCLTGALHWRRGQISLLGQAQARCAAVVTNSRLQAHSGTLTGFFDALSVLSRTGSLVLLVSLKQVAARSDFGLLKRKIRTQKR